MQTHTTMSYTIIKVALPLLIAATLPAQSIYIPAGGSGESTINLGSPNYVGEYGIAIGLQSQSYGVAIGHGAKALGVASIAIGTSSDGQWNDPLASGFGSIALGPYAVASAESTFAVHLHAEATQANALAIGAYARAIAANAVAVGAGASASAKDSVVLGQNSTYLRKDGTLVTPATANPLDPVLIAGVAPNSLILYRDGSARFPGGIELKSSSGIVTLSPGTDGGNRTITLPNSSGPLLNANSSLAADKLTGSVPAASLPAGVTQLGDSIDLASAEATGNLPWSRVSDKPTTLAAMNLPDSLLVTRNSAGRISSAIRIEPQGDIPMFGP